MTSEITKWMGIVPKVESKELLPPTIETTKTHSEKKAEFENNAFVIYSTTIVDTCTGEEFASEREAAIIRSIDYDKLIIYLNSDDNPTA